VRITDLSEIPKLTGSMGSDSHSKLGYMLETPGIQQYLKGNNLLVRTISRQPRSKLVAFYKEEK